MKDGIAHKYEFEIKQISDTAYSVEFDTPLNKFEWDKFITLISTFDRERRYDQGRN